MAKKIISNEIRDLILEKVENFNQKDDTLYLVTIYSKIERKQL